MWLAPIHLMGLMGKGNSMGVLISIERCRGATGRHVADLSRLREAGTGYLGTPQQFVLNVTYGQHRKCISDLDMRSCL